LEKRVQGFKGFYPNPTALITASNAIVYITDSIAPLIYSEALISEELIRIEGVNRNGYIIFFQVI
jgi:hypothetical protein